MGFLSALGLSAGTSVLGGLINQSFAKDNMDYQNQLNQQNWTNSLLNGPLLQQQGYAKAGINPLLALGHSAESMAPVSLGQSQGIDGASIVNSALAAEKVEQEERLANAKLEQDQDLIDAQKDKINAEINSAEVKDNNDTKLVDAQIKRMDNQNNNDNVDRNEKRYIIKFNNQFRKEHPAISKMFDYAGVQPYGSGGKIVDKSIGIAGKLLNMYGAVKAGRLLKGVMDKARDINDALERLNKNYVKVNKGWFS